MDELDGFENAAKPVALARRRYATQRGPLTVEELRMPGTGPRTHAGVRIARRLSLITLRTSCELSPLRCLAKSVGSANAS
jgi:hypothetical protein